MTGKGGHYTGCTDRRRKTEEQYSSTVIQYMMVQVYMPMNVNTHVHVHTCTSMYNELKISTSDPYVGFLKGD